MKNALYVSATLLLTAACAVSASADVNMPAVFGDHMVLQRGIELPIWGTADPGEKVTVSFAGQTVSAQADADGKWMVRLASLEANSQPQTLTVKGNNTLRFQDVLVGDVWVCSGQSNMVWAAGMAYGIPNGPAEIEAANYPGIRMITIPGVAATEPQTSFDGSLTPTVDYDGHWAACTPEVMKMFSAVSYFFGRKLHKELDVPIGLIGAYWSGTPAQAWTSRQTLAADPRLATYLAKWEQYARSYPEVKAQYDARAAKAKAEGYTLSGWFDPEPQDPVTSGGRPGNLFDGMIAPLIPFAIRGAIWYQGESNSGTPEEAMLYHHLFSTMITDWRTHWGQGDFPFFLAQICTLGKRQEQPVEPTGPPLLRESQLKTLALANTGMAVIIDTDVTGNLHPPDKKPVGERLALAALKVAYGKDVVHSGPVMERMEKNGREITLHFKHADGGLTLKPENGRTGFAIAGRDRKFVWADARIEGDTIVVFSPQVNEPEAVRYAWANNPPATLWNAAGLPASPFRTDSWPAMVSDKKR
jgi:sialate O-acetylesterase